MILELENELISMKNKLNIIFIISIFLFSCSTISFNVNEKVRLNNRFIIGNDEYLDGIWLLRGYHYNSLNEKIDSSWSFIFANPNQLYLENQILISTSYKNSKKSFLLVKLHDDSTLTVYKFKNEVKFYKKLKSLGINGIKFKNIDSFQKITPVQGNVK